MLSLERWSPTSTKDKFSAQAGPMKTTAIAPATVEVIKDFAIVMKVDHAAKTTRVWWSIKNSEKIALSYAQAILPKTTAIALVTASIDPQFANVVKLNPVARISWAYLNPGVKSFWICRPPIPLAMFPFLRSLIPFLRPLIPFLLLLGEEWPKTTLLRFRCKVMKNLKSIAQVLRGIATVIVTALISLISANAP